MKVLRTTYLHPKHMRYGSRGIVFVEKVQTRFALEISYWLGVASGKFKTDKQGRGIPYARGYESVMKVVITEEFYNAFLEESAKLHKQFKQKKSK